MEGVLIKKKKKKGKETHNCKHKKLNTKTTIGKPSEINSTKKKNKDRI